MVVASTPISSHSPRIRHALRSADAIAALVRQYGFRTLEQAKKEKQDTENKEGGRAPEAGRFAHLSRGARSPLRDSQLPACLKNTLLPLSSENQLMLCAWNPEHAQARSPRISLSLEIFGVGDALAEVLLIKTALTILDELGRTGSVVRINSMGDHDSCVRFLRECSVYYARRRSDLHAACAGGAIRENILKLFRCRHPACRDVRNEAPRPINFLSEKSRRHLKDMLEYLEVMRIPYELDDSLIPDEPRIMKTVFEVVWSGEGESARPASGGRYDDFGKTLGLRKDLPAVGMSLSLPDIAAAPAQKQHPSRPGIYFIRIGPEARRKSMTLLDTLRRAHAPVYIPLAQSAPTFELRRAEELRVPYIMIMGHKEAMENTVIVRRAETRAQDTVPLALLEQYLKKIRFPDQKKSP